MISALQRQLKSKVCILLHAKTSSSVRIINFRILSISGVQFEGGQMMLCWHLRYLPGFVPMWTFKLKRHFSSSRTSFPLYTRPQNHLNIASFFSKYSNLKNDSSETVSLTGKLLINAISTFLGRIVCIRSSGKRLHFIDLLQDGHKLQLIFNQSNASEIVQNIRKGDIVEASGFAGLSQTGQLSCKLSSLKVLTPCQLNLPDAKIGLKDPELRCRQRHLDLLANPHSLRTFKARSRIISQLRRFLEERDFLEVETPILSQVAGGATARPFKTSPDENPSTSLSLRIAPELYLKRLIVGGMERIFELGKQFRDEGVDSTHNPEFTSCELYAAYFGLDEMAAMIEEVWAYLNENNTTFGKTFQKLDIFDEINTRTGLKLKPSAELEEQLKSSEIEKFTSLPSDAPVSRIFDRLVGRFVEPLCQQPTLLFGHPIFTSPLAQADPQNPFLAKRFELFVGGRELANAYAELNDPQVQLLRFQQQAKLKQAGDNEVPPADFDFVKALEAGMPPTTGCGIGIDRLVMLLTGNKSIRDVILYPATW